MSIFDVLTNGSLGSVIGNIANQAKSAASGFGDGGSGAFGNIGGMLETIANKAKDTATNIRDNTPGGIGGLAGAGALGALLGNVFSGDIMKSVALAGAGAVAWNFYKKWAAEQKGGGEQSIPRAPQAAADAPAGWGNLASSAQTADTMKPIDPTAELAMRAMIYAARADGTIDAAEQDRIHQIMRSMLPGQDVDAAIAKIGKESIDPAKIASAVISPEQGQDIFRLSCAVIDIDHFMEVSYLDALAKSLNIDDSQKKQLEEEAIQAKTALKQSIRQ